MDYIILNVSN